MKLPDESQAGVPNSGAAGDSKGRAAAKPRAGLFELLIRLAEDSIASVNGLVEVQTDRVRLGVRRLVVKVVLGAAAALCASFWLSAAALATLRGLCGAFTALCGGREWLGQLCGGITALLLAAGVVALVLKLSTRSELIRLEAKYERIRNEAGRSNEHEVPPPDGGAAARSRGSAGIPAHQRIAAARG
jgi:hypothetical protein